MFEVPKGSRKNSIFCSGLWIGGRDELDSLHFAGERYRQGPGTGMPWLSPDFYAGPIMDSTNYSIFQDTAWNYIWNLKKSEIDYHRAHFWETGYEPIKDIRSWPGNGDTALGQSHKLAPFSDRNGDGFYDPMDGDYPEIRGDQALFFIFNDDRGPHLESEGEKLRVEIHGMAYAFDLPDDSAFKSTVFLHYKLYNRSQHVYDSTYAGIFTDIDLGYGNDDYIGCDVERNIYYGYNGTPVDGTGQESAYGENPPAQAVSIMAGPYLDPDGIDNPRYSSEGNQLCDHSINGIHFGDSVVDNERYGLCKFVYFNNSNAGVPSYMTDPQYAFEYYKFLRGIWKDDSRMIYGGLGHVSAGGYGPVCDFMFPGESDSLDWGTGCQPPNGSKNWTELIAGNNPQDRRAMGSLGPFTFQPGGVQEIDLAFSWARDYSSRTPLSSLAKLRTFVDTINAAFTSNTLPGGNPFYGISDRDKPLELLLKIYPNPTRDLINIQFDTQAITGNSNIVLQTMQGNLLKRFVISSPLSTFTMDVSDIPSGFYLLKIVNNERVSIVKVIIEK
jgi:hypothetical protein